MNFKDVKQHLASVIFVGATFAGAFSAAWGILDKRLDTLEARQEKAEQLELANKSRSLELQSRENELLKEQSAVQKMKVEAEATLAMANDKEHSLAAASAKISVATNHAAELGVIRSLMGDFSKLGVDLSADPPCGDRDLMAKYNQAKALLDEIASRAENIGEYAYVQSFISKSTGFSVAMPCKSVIPTQ